MTLGSNFVASEASRKLWSARGLSIFFCHPRIIGIETDGLRCSEFAFSNPSLKQAKTALALEVIKADREQILNPSLYH